MAVECADCGARSELDEHFARVRRSFSRRWRRVCPRCQVARFEREMGGLHRWILGSSAAIAAVVLWRPEWPPGWVMLYSSLFSLACIAVVPIHEAGHALAARALGLRLFGVTLGAGPLRRRFKVLGVRVDWRAIPAGGLTHAAPVGAHGIRWRLAVLALAGPAMNAALAAAAWPWLPGFESWEAWRTPAGAVAFGWVGANAIVALGSLIPYRQRSAIGPTPTDGLLFLTAFFAGPDVLRRWRAGRFELEVGLLREEREFAAALDVVREGLMAIPDDFILNCLLGVVLADAGRNEEARTLFLEQLGDDLPAVERAITLSNVAWCNFVSGRDDRLEEAAQCSEEAHRTLAWIPAVQNTRGAVLTWSGRADEGLPLLQAAFQGVEVPVDRARVACVKALAHRQLGEAEEAKRALELARSLDPECELLERAGG